MPSVSIVWKSPNRTRNLRFQNDPLWDLLDKHFNALFVLNTFFLIIGKTVQKREEAERAPLGASLHPLAPRGVHKSKGHTLCLTTPVWKPGRECCLCLAAAQKNLFPPALSHPQERRYCTAPAPTTGNTAQDHITSQIYLS